ncbi:MAG TPA: DNA methyltransferase [Planctomycetota bacterium]|jgi:DNA modification methylase|nr:hypothetical protein [Planctomycetota bacterium]OQC19257.1 MAG: DNA methylase [Planctomycetes bacterium ADurb.Bin069]NMD34363.1 hypothetical protein [Planctomycetota bacterium]HNS00292.1 DNA methyltransferase [Planctomycetota bacterium]HNU27322.1 DNA methyltransferase [Planctomycetota bacterium]
MADKRMARNSLNDLSGREWLFFTNTVWETNAPADRTHAFRKCHGAIKPPAAMAELVRFFTRRGERVLDPFAGVGGILLGAELEERRSVGVEIDQRWVDVFNRVRRHFGVRDGMFVARDEFGGEGSRPIGAEMVCASCLEYMAAQEAASFDAVITDPPYGVQHKPRGFAAETNFAMSSADARDFANAATFEDYLTLMREFGEQARRLLRPGRYLVILIGDRYHEGEYLPLGVKVAEAVRQAGFEWKGLKVWWNKATLRRFRPYAVGTCFVPNITHQNVVILRRK